MLFFEKVTFQMSPEGRLEESQGKRWRGDILSIECGHWILVEQDLSYFNPKAWSNVGYFQICADCWSWGKGSSLKQGYVLFRLPRLFPCKWLMVSSVDFIQWMFYSQQTLKSQSWKETLRSSGAQKLKKDCTWGGSCCWLVVSAYSSLLGREPIRGT